MKSLFALVLLLPVLFGCAVSATYKLPEGEQKAYVRFKTKGDYYTYFRTNERSACPEPSMRSLASFSWTFQEQLSDVRMLGSTGKADKYQVERLIQAGAPFYMLAGSEKVATSAFDPGYVCTLGVRVTFKPEHHYEVEFEFERGSCGVRVWELVELDREVRRIPQRSASSFRARHVHHLCHG